MALLSSIKIGAKKLTNGKKVRMRASGVEFHVGAICWSLSTSSCGIIVASSYFS